MKKSFTDQLSNCKCCPRRCGVNRLKGKTGFCRIGAAIEISHAGLHFGEEPPISGTRGSGTIFFSGCNMRCVYCQNYRFSQLDQGREISVKDLSQIMLKLRDRGCHNINLVSPTHFISSIMAALELALEGGLNIPILYNTSGY